MQAENNELISDQISKLQEEFLNNKLNKSKLLDLSSKQNKRAVWMQCKNISFSCLINFENSVDEVERSQSFSGLSGLCMVHSRKASPSNIQC